MYFQTNDGLSIMGNTALEIIEKLRADSFDPRASVEEFMEATAEAAHLQTGAVISTFDYESFVTDLEHNGFLIPQKEIELK